MQKSRVAFLSGNRNGCTVEQEEGEKEKERDGDEEEVLVKDVLYGLTSAGRTTPVRNAVEIVGPVINTFPVRMPFLSGGADTRTVAETVQNMHTQISASLEYEGLPLTHIKALAEGCRGGQLFNAIFDFQQEAWDAELGMGLKLDHSRLIDTVGTPLTIRVITVSEKEKEKEKGKGTKEISRGEGTSNPTSNRTYGLNSGNSGNSGGLDMLQLHATSENQTLDDAALLVLLQEYKDILEGIVKDISAGEFKLEFKFKRLYLYTVDSSFHVQWCIRQV